MKNAIATVEIFALRPSGSPGAASDEAPGSIGAAGAAGAAGRGAVADPGRGAEPGETGETAEPAGNGEAGGARAPETPARRLTLVITQPERVGSASGSEEAWSCRVALADLHRPETVSAPDSILALARALDRARGWLADLEARGHVLARDRSGSPPFVLE